MFIFTKKLKAVKVALTSLRWQQKDSNQILYSKKVLEEIHSSLNSGPFDTALHSKAKRPTASIVEYQYLEEMDLKQKSRIQWLNEGGSNTSFFHKSIKKRQSSNTIRSLKAKNGHIVNQKDQVAQEPIDQFQQVWSNPSNQPILYPKAKRSLPNRQR